MDPTNRMMAWAQIIFSMLIFSIVGAVMLIFETGHSHMTDASLATFDRDFGWLKDAALMVLVFWFQRARQGGIPDQSQMVVQSHTAPDGSKTTITAPVGAPAGAVPILKTSSQSSNQADQTATSTGAVAPLSQLAEKTP